MRTTRTRNTGNTRSCARSCLILHHVCGLVCQVFFCFVLFCLLVWDHYHPFLLCVPFLSWLLLGRRTHTHTLRRYLHHHFDHVLAMEPLMLSELLLLLPLPHSHCFLEARFASLRRYSKYASTSPLPNSILSLSSHVFMFACFLNFHYHLSIYQPYLCIATDIPVERKKVRLS